MNESIAKDKKVQFIAQGVIVGYTCGAEYESLQRTTKYIRNTLKVVNKDLQADFEKKCLSQYGDFETYKGAYIEVLQVSTVNVDGVIYTNETEVEPIILGKLYNDDIDVIKTKMLLNQI